MDEDQYRSVYRSVNEHKCVFEKTINARHGNCSCAKRFNLADREGVACEQATRHEYCLNLLTQLRSNASFTLRSIHIEGQLPHANEIRVQAGGLIGIQDAVIRKNPAAANIHDIDGLLRAAEQEYGEIENFPFSEIIKTIANFKGRQRRKR